MLVQVRPGWWVATTAGPFLAVKQDADGTGVFIREVGTGSQIERKLDSGVGAEQLVAALNSPELRAMQLMERQNELLSRICSRLHST